MNDIDRAALLRTNPERYATTGLSWSNPAHYVPMANGLFQTLMMVLAKEQGLRNDAQHRALRMQRGRIEQRLSVVERAAWRDGVRLARPMDDKVVVYGLEKMADALEEGAEAWQRAMREAGSNVLAGTMLGVAVGFAAEIRGHRACERFSVGPFGGLSKVAQLVTRPDVLVEMEDLPALDGLVQKARGIPVGHAVTHQNETCAGFYDAFDALLAKLQKRDQDRSWL